MGKLLIESLDHKVKTRKIAKAVYRVLGQKAKLKAELVFADKEGMHTLNRNTRGVDSVTDVLSYPSLDGIRGKILRPEECVTELEGKYIFIGSIVLCEDRIRTQAKEYGNTYEQEREYLIIHGLLHLLGYDHMNDIDKKEMRDKEKAVLAVIHQKENAKKAKAEQKKAQKQAKLEQQTEDGQVQTPVQDKEQDLAQVEQKSQTKDNE